MIVVKKIDEAREAVSRIRQGGAAIGLVPTMGALHAGHLALARRSRADGCATVVSIYVNPTQFGPKEDFGKYPRPLEKDLQLCRDEGVQLVFCPESDEMYPAGHRTWVDVEKLTDGMCGAFRPGHFKGVATIVAKLLLIVRPDAAYFGRKDFQQLKVVERMNADLNLAVRIVGCPTVREPDGLALSSRNAYLGPEDRRRARIIPRTLSEVASRWSAGERRASELLLGLKERLTSQVDLLQYFGAYNVETLQEVAPDEPLLQGPVVALAARVGTTRLIDNVELGADPMPIKQP
jgi:pantoate--beta-alanine ligase